MCIVSSTCRVKLLGGTRQVPVIRKQPNGKSHSRYKKSANSLCVRFILLISTESVYRTSPLRMIFMEMVVSGEIGLRVRWRHGPSAAERSYDFAWGRYNGFSPSMLRELISFPHV